MDQPARKRRKTTSPRENERASSPLKQRPRRPSFASPTKASLARFNPNLLPPQPTSSSSGPSRPDSRGNIQNRGKQARAFIFGETETLELGDEGTPRDENGQAMAGAKQQPTAENATPKSRRRAPTRRFPGGNEGEAEAELPTTPSVRATEEHDTPRRGVLFSSPSKRPPRRKELPGPSTQKPDERPLQRRRSSVSADAPEIREAEIAPQVKRNSPDPELEDRKREKEKLLAELKGLEEDVLWCANQLRQNQDTTAFFDAAEQADTISFINKISDVGKAEDGVKAPPLSNLLCSFLPFSALVVQTPRLEPAQQKPVPSHRPIALENPLPYLQMFTSFRFDYQIDLSNPENFDNKTTQIHQRLRLNIADSLKLLTASFEVSVDTSNYEIVAFQIPRISSWAERELVSFATKKAQDNDLNTACWAMGSYWELAKKRAEYRHKCQTTFQHLIPGRTSEDTENITEKKGKSPKSMSRKDYLRHLGRDVLVLQDRHILLSVTWCIGFDWTGEAESDINVETAFPRVWQEADSQHSFRKIPETFNTLLKSRGIFEATRIIVALLFDNE